MRAGVVLQGRYEIVGTLGAGGQGTVFEAVDRRLGIRVAVKRSVERRHELREAFVREARLLASLRHPCLPIVSDFFVEEEGAGQESQYLVMELVRGEDLENRVSRESGPCAVADVLDWADQLLDALAYLHGHTPPILHRDIKPRNLKVRPDGRLVLLDFGLAKGRPIQDPSLAPLPSLGGYSHGFAPIEQMFMLGTDPRSDLYAVGATLYYLLSGLTPPDATVRDRELGRRGDPLPPLEASNPAVPGQIAGLIHHALELNAERRFQTANEMRQALARARRDLLGDSRSGGEAGGPEPDGGLSDVPTVVRMVPSQPPARTSEHSAPPWPGAQRPTTGTSVTPAGGEAEARPSAGAAPPADAVAPSDDADAPAGDHAVPLGQAAPVRGMEAIAEPVAAGPPVPAGRPGAPSARAGGSAGAWLAVAHGEQATDRWPLPTDRPVRIGRGAAGAVAPDVDLWPDRHVSREHARLWHAEGRWWLEDAGSKHGTRLEGRLLQAGRPVVVRPWSHIQLGETVLFLAPPTWRRLLGRDVAIDLDVVGAVSSALAHAGLPIVGRALARSRARVSRPAGRLDLRLEPCIEPVSVALPALDPRASVSLTLPPVMARYDVLEGQLERSRRRLVATIDGEAARGDLVECWLLPHNEWSTLPEHRRALATFVLPNHPAVAGLCLEVVTTAGLDASPERLLGALFDVLAVRWQLAYRVEPPHWGADSQKIRLPHQILLDDATRQGEGTCLDLALLVAAGLENLGLQALVAVVDLGDWWHALVGCWSPAGAALEPIQHDAARLLTGSVWIDPTSLTRDPAARRPFEAARAEADRHLRERPLVFALDVAAARQAGITPLPFAGAPAWSAEVARAIEAAQAEAQAAGGQLCSAALLAGLLAANGRLTRRLVARALGPTERAAQVIRSALPPAPAGGAPTPGYRQVLSLARSRAKDAGSPLVLEEHLLAALLAVRSVSLERALGRLGTDQPRVAEALRDLAGGAAEGTGSLLSL